MPVAARVQLRQAWPSQGSNAWDGFIPGFSARGRPIKVTGFANAGRPPSPRPRILVVGCIHGTECAGIAVFRQLLHDPHAHAADLVMVRNLNPDGLRLGTRLNARGVDLNRNFAGGWMPIGTRGDPQYSGPRPFSEPETRWARLLIRSVRPDVTIWFHQQAQPLVRAWGQSIPVARRYARLAGLPFYRLPWLAGTASHWQNLRFPGRSSFVVELPPGRLSSEVATRHIAAIETLAGYPPIDPSAPLIPDRVVGR